MYRLIHKKCVINVLDEDITKEGLFLNSTTNEISKCLIFSTEEELARGILLSYKDGSTYFEIEELYTAKKYRFSSKEVTRVINGE